MSRSLRRRALGIAALAAILAVLPFAATAQSASASRYLMTGIFDDAHILGGDPDTVFPLLTELHARMIRLNLWWGGPLGVANARPGGRGRSGGSGLRLEAVRPHRPCCRRGNGIRVMFTISGRRVGVRGQRLEPGAARGRRPEGVREGRRPPVRRHVRSGRRRAPFPACATGRRGTSRTTPYSCAPSTAGRHKWVVQSARDYARICNAVVAGVKSVPRLEATGGVRCDGAAREQPAPACCAGVSLAARLPSGDERPARGDSTPTHITLITAPRARRRRQRRRRARAVSRRRR